MTENFVQVTARKSNGDFALASTGSLMSSQGLTYIQSLRYLNVMADSYRLNGYEIEWTEEADLAVDF